MKLLECPKCRKALNPPFKSSKRQVCTRCGWSSKRNKKKLAIKKLKKSEIILMVVIALIVTIKVVMDYQYREYIENKLYLREVFLNPRLSLIAPEMNFEVWREEEETAVSNMASLIFMKNMSVGDKIVPTYNLHKKGEIVSIPDKENKDEVGVEFDNIKYQYSISPAELIVIDPSNGKFISNIEDFKEEAKKEVNRIKKEEEEREKKYIKIADKMLKNFSPGTTVILKNDYEIKGIVTEVHRDITLVEVQWDEGSNYRKSLQKPENLKIVNPNTNTVLWQAPLL